LVPIVPWIVKHPSNGALNQPVLRFGENSNVTGNARGTEDHPDYPLAFWAMDGNNSQISMRINYTEPIFLHLDPGENRNWPELWRVQTENYTNSEWASYFDIVYRI
jgi:hypothetical protein